MNHPANSDIEVTFGNSHHEDPISIVVRMTPFSHGRAYSAASKTITIRVDPYNPYPKGIPTSTANITIRYASSPKDSYEQGSSLIVNWTDTLSRDPCVNVLLAKDNGNGLQYVGRVSQECLRPAAAGSFTWTIPGKYSGSGFRIYAAAPGGTSSAFGPAFSILKPGPEPQGKP